MSVDLTIPQWLKDYVQLWADRLLISQEWKIEICLEQCVGDDATTYAESRYTPKLNTATIAFRADVEETANWKVTAIHELLHIKHARICSAFRHVIVREMVRGGFEDTAHAAFNDPLESYIESMANVLYDLATPL